MTEQVPPQDVPPPVDVPPAGGAASPDDPPAAPSSSTASPPSSHLETTFQGDTYAKTLNIIETLTKVKTLIQIGDSGRLSPRLFSAKNAPEVSNDTQEQVRRQSVGPEPLLDRLERVLTQRRILLLAGSRSSGRFSSSVALAQRIEIDKTRFVTTLDRQMRIDLRDTLAAPEFKGCFTIFRDVFDGSNSDLLRFFSSLDGHGCDQLGRTLQDNEAFLIFTTTAPQLRRFAPRIVDLDIHQELGQTSPEALTQALERRLDREKEGETAGWQDALRADIGNVAKHFHSVGSLNRAVDSLSRHWTPGQSVIDYLRHYRSLGTWIDSDLRDLHTWTFAFTLGLMHCRPDSNGVPWTEFEWLRRTIWRGLSGDPEWKQWRTQRPDEAAASDSAMAADNALIETCGAQVTKDPVTLRDIIRFTDQRNARELWEAFLAHNRRVLTFLMPGFIDIAEKKSQYTVAQRRLLAGILGRIGEIDPSEITLSLVLRWSAAEEEIQILVGPLLQSVVASTNEKYRRFCFDFLQGLAARSEADELLALIGAYAEIGEFDPEIAIEGLLRVSDLQLAPMIADMQRMGNLVGRIQRDIRDGRIDEATVGRMFEHFLIRELSYRLYSDRGGIFIGIQEAVIALCVRRNLDEVLSLCDRWLSSRSENALVLALLFVKADGVASRLEEFAVHLGDAGTGVARPNPFVWAIGTDAKSSLVLSTFVSRVHQRILDSFRRETELRRNFEAALIDHILLWTLNAAPLPAMHEPLIEFFVRIARANMGAMHDPLMSMLRRDDVSVGGSAEQRLAIAILNKLTL